MLAFLQWVVRRGLRLAYLSVEARFPEIIPLLVANPRMVEGRLKLLCTDQANMDELECVLQIMEDSSHIKFELNICPQSAFSIRDAANLRRHVSDSVSWNAEFTNTEEIAALVCDNHSVHDVSIDKPTLAAAEITASLGASLQSLSLCGREVTDAMLERIASACYKIRDLSLDMNHHCSLSAGVIAAAKGCRELRKVTIGCHVTDDGVTALCTHCPHLEDLDVLHGFLTTPALAGLIASDAPISRLAISWKAASATGLHHGTKLLTVVHTIVVIMADATYAPTLALALSLMTKLGALVLACADTVTPFPAETVAQLVHSCPVMSAVTLALQTVSGGTEALWRQMFVERPALRSFRCTGANGVEFTACCRQWRSTAGTCSILRLERRRP